MLNGYNSNNLSGWSTSQKLPLNGFELIKNGTFTKDFVKVYQENSESLTLSSSRTEIFLAIVVVSKQAKFSSWEDEKR